MIEGARSPLTGPGAYAAMRNQPTDAGYTLLELVFALALAATVAATAVPVTTTAVDHLRTSGAARYAAGRIAASRLDAIRRSTTVALRFEPAGGGDYAFALFVDGNADGLRAIDVSRGIDRPVTRPERLGHRFAGTRFGLLPGIPDLEGGQGNTDGLRIGSSSFLSLSPDGGATSGTLYVHGRRSQYAVRIFGVTGRLRVFRYDAGVRRWITR